MTIVSDESGLGHRRSLGRTESAIDGPDGWRFLPEGAAWHPASEVLVVADLHLGHEWARAASGDMVLPHTREQVLGRLGSAFDRIGSQVRELIVAGDLVESPGLCVRTHTDVRALGAWLDRRGVALVRLQGNHDDRRDPSRPLTRQVEDWTIAHGDRPVESLKVVIGHYHPALKAGGLSAPCFLAGPTLIVLPALSPSAAGWDVTAFQPPPPHARETLRCFATSPTELLDFGPLPDLDAALHPSRCPRR